MIEKNYSNKNNKFDWGKTTSDYAKFRPPPPLSYYKKLQALDVGTPGQRILDLGTGLGSLARQFARQGCMVVGIDRSPEQIEMAEQLSKNDKVRPRFQITTAEEMQFPDNSFDIATAMQCWGYFKTAAVIPKVQKLLVENGLLVVSNFDGLPKCETIAEMTEALILKYNPSWDQGGWDGHIPASLKWAQDDFNVKAMFYYDEPIKFTRDSWRGRIRASQAIAACLPDESVRAFDGELEELLERTAPKEFTILHRISTHILEKKHVI